MMGFRKIFKGLQNGALTALPVVAILSLGGVVLGMITLTGLGLMMSSMLIRLSGGNLLILLFRMPRSPWRATLRWGLGLTTLWALLAMLWLPWIDYGKSYRGVSAEFARLLGDRPGCIARRNLGLAQRASLDYFNGIRTVQGERAKSCRYLIQQAAPKSTTTLAGWKLLRETSRPGDKKESLRLYRRD